MNIFEWFIGKLKNEKQVDYSELEVCPHCPSRQSVTSVSTSEAR